MNQLKAQSAKNLGNDPVFQEVVEAIRQEQANVFLKAGSSIEDIEQAHAIVRALDKIDGYIRSANNELAVAQRTGQHREND